jgi:CheY-like chemotaxis protein
MFRALTTTDSVSLVFEDPGSILSLHTDESKVSQILRNFVSNALKFTEQGEVRVCAAHNAEWDEIIFSVTDTGIGAPEHQERIFEEFAQIDSPMQRRVKGTGLGLPLCKRLAELLGGMVTVSSRPGIGSKFTAHIPRRYQGDSLNLRPAAGQRRLLVIDDEEISRYLLRQLLTGGYEILEASGGEDGLKQARESKPDMIFLHLAMPGLNGFEVLTQLKADPKHRYHCDVTPDSEPDEERLLAQGTWLYSQERLGPCRRVVRGISPGTVSARCSRS